MLSFKPNAITDLSIFVEIIRCGSTMVIRLRQNNRSFSSFQLHITRVQHRPIIDLDADEENSKPLIHQCCNIRESFPAKRARNCELRAIVYIERRPCQIEFFPIHELQKVVIVPRGGLGAEQVSCTVSCRLARYHVY